MERKSLATFGILMILLASMVGTVAAQSVTTTETTPTAEPTTVAGAKFFAHPVVMLLSAYFDREQVTNEEVTPTATTEAPTGEATEPSDTPEPTETEVAPESGLGPIGEEIAALHEEGMGFGVLVKLYAMAEASAKACPTVEVTPTPVPSEEPTAAADTTETPVTCTAVTAQELVDAFKNGTGMGNLFKEYGKPALLGVGHVKKALAAAPTATETPEPAADATMPGKGKGQHHPKK